MISRSFIGFLRFLSKQNLYPGPSSRPQIQTHWDSTYQRCPHRRNRFAWLRPVLTDVAAAARATGESWWTAPWAEPGAVTLPFGLSADLDRLPVPVRARLAWTALGRAHDPDPGTAPGTAPDPQLLAGVVAAVPGLPVPPPTGAEPARRRRRVLSVLAVVTLALLVGVAVTALLPDPAPPEPALGPVAVSPARNPACHAGLPFLTLPTTVLFMGTPALKAMGKAIIAKMTFIMTPAETTHAR